MNNQNISGKNSNSETMKEILITIAVVIVCVLLIGMIISKHGYGQAYANRDSYVAGGYEEDSYEENSYEENSYEDDSFVVDAEEDGYIEEFEDPAELQSEGAQDDFILPASSERYLSIYELEELTSEELRIARNEIYARKGRRFKDEALQRYFDSKSWYMGTIDPDSFTDDMLTEIELENAKMISEYEAQLNQ